MEGSDSTTLRRKRLKEWWRRRVAASWGTPAARRTPWREARARGEEGGDRAHREARVGEPSGESVSRRRQRTSEAASSIGRIASRVAEEPSRASTTAQKGRGRILERSGFLSDMTDPNMTRKDGLVGGHGTTALMTQEEACS
jgi:hypothetical protein